MTLTVDRDTQVVGRPRHEDASVEGRRPSRAISDLVNPSDSVVVTYVDAGAGQLGDEVNVRQTAK